MIALVLAALLQSVPASSNPSVPPAPQPSPQATATASPSAAAAAPAPSASPSAYRYVMNYAPPATPTDGPLITQVSLNDRTLHAGGPLLIQVTTSPNVVGVEARCFGRFVAIPQVSPGIFALNYTLPAAIPFYLFRSFDIVIAAATPDGRQTTTHFPLTLSP